MQAWHGHSLRKEEITLYNHLLLLLLPHRFFSANEKWLCHSQQPRLNAAAQNLVVFILSDCSVPPVR